MTLQILRNLKQKPTLQRKMLLSLKLNNKTISAQAAAFSQNTRDYSTR